MRILARLLGIVVFGLLLVAPAARPASAEEPCAKAFDLVLTGQLKQAELLAKAPALAGCGLTEVIEAAEAQADKLLGEAKEKAHGSDGQKALLARAHAINGDNEEVNNLLARLAEEKESASNSKPSPCAAAADALARGEWTSATTLYETASKTDEGKECGTAGAALVAKAQAVDPAQRLTTLLTNDAIPVGGITVACFLLGLIFGGFLRVGHGGTVAAISGAFLALMGFLWILARWRDPSPNIPAQVIQLIPTLGYVSAAILGLAFASYLRSRSPIRVQLEADADKALGPLIVDAIHDVSGAPPSGATYVAGTDVVTDLAAVVPGEASNALTKALAAVWSKLTSALGQRLVILSLGDGEVLLRLEDTFRKPKVKQLSLPSDAAGLTSAEAKHRLLALMIASWVLVKRTKSHDQQRLYGATSPLGMALAVMAGDSMKAERPTDAVLLYQRAVADDPLNLAAAYGLLSAMLLQRPDDITHAQERLDQLAKEIENKYPRTPLEWRVRYSSAAIRIDTLMGESEKKDEEIKEAIGDLEKLGQDANPSSSDPQFGADIARRTKSIVAVLKILSDESWLQKTATKLREGNYQGPAAHFVLANLGAAAAHFARVGSTPSNNRMEFIELTAKHLRLAGEDQTRRGRWATDPVIALVTSEEQIKKAIAGWVDAPLPPLAGVRCFGDEGAALAADRAGLDGLWSKLKSRTDRAEFQREHGLDKPTLRSWAGAVEWVRAGRKAETINLFHALGIRCAADLRNVTDETVLIRLVRLTQHDSSVKLPDLDTRLSMRLPAPERWT